MVSIGVNSPIGSVSVGACRRRKFFAKPTSSPWLGAGFVFARITASVPETANRGRDHIGASTSVKRPLRALAAL